MMKLEPAMLKKMVHAVITTRPDELTCDECFGEIDRFVEMELAGKNAAEAMPLVEDHLQRCHDCHEEFEALLAVLKALHAEE
ncbi:MAG: hypothetical protein MAG431_01826 [Chloroflexi bacterium]|nr:hypothetical protein [Chloroflexota bacterium]